MTQFLFLIKGDSANGPNILDELSTALNKLQSTLLEEQEMVTDTRKRNTILTLVAWLKRVLQTSTTDNAEAQLFSLTDLLPTELLLSKLMPQLNNGNGNDNDNDESTPDDRSPSSKRFSRQKNNRFNTVGVSKEELADARLYLQKKLLSENLAQTTATKVSHEVEQQAILHDDSDDSRRKSLNLTYSNDLDKDIRSIFRESKNSNSFSKSIDIVPSPDSVNLKNVFPVNRLDPTNPFVATKATATATTTATTRTEQTTSQSKTAFRRKSNASNNTLTDSDDEDPNNAQQISTNVSANNPNKSMNKFALRKMKMKRANTIDVPKEQLAALNSDHGFSAGYKNTFNHEKTVNDIRENIKSHCSNEVDKDHLPDFQVKSSSDKKFIAFLNKNADESQTTYVNPLKTTLPVQKANWSNKFGNLKNSFEHDGPQLPVSPRLSKKNNFTHAPTSPFKVVQGNKPPQVPNGIHHPQYNIHSVHNKVAAFQALDKQAQTVPNPKPQLRSYQSVPLHANDDHHHPVYRDPNIHIKPNNWQQNKFGSMDSYIQNTESPKMQQTAYNPLYVPLNQSPSNPIYTPSYSNQITPKSHVSASPNDFPTYTYTSTDYTQPTSVSTFGPETFTPPVNNPSPVIKNTILPDTSYLKSTSPPRTMPPPMLGSSKLNRQMKTVDVYSSNEYLSEPNNYYRSPQPFSPNYDYNYAPSHTSHDSRRSSGEFMATSQIMKYPQSQTATVVNKITTRYDDEKQAANLRSFLTNNRNEKRQSEYSEKSMSPLSEPNFSHVNETYVPPVEPVRVKPNNNYISMDNISGTQFSTPEQGAPICLRNNTSYYGSHNVLVSNQNEFAPKPYELPSQTLPTQFDSRTLSNKKIEAPVKLNSCGGQYIQPKVGSNLDFSKPTYGRKYADGDMQYNGSKGTNLNRSHTIQHQRNNTGNYEIKRKQSLPPQNTDYFDYMDYDNQNDESPHNHKYLPFGALKKSKSTHTLALLQQFESKGKTQEAPLPSYIRRPTFNEPKPVEIKPKSIIKKTSRVEEHIRAQPAPKPIQQAPKPIQQTPKPIQQITKPIQQAPKPIQQITKPIQQASKPIQQAPKLVPQPQAQPQSPPFANFETLIRAMSPPSAPVRQKTPPRIEPVRQKTPPRIEPVPPKTPPKIETVRQKTPPKIEPVRPKTPPKVAPVRPKTPPQKVPIRPKTPPQKSAPVQSKTPQTLEPPEITETPSSPLVEDGHIIFPGQTKETKRRVQHYAKTLNAMLNRKSVLVDDDDEEEQEQVNEKKDTGKGVQRSKSGTLLTVPKQYESAIKRSEVLEKERTVAAYFSGNKSPQGLQRSSSQHSVQSSTSMRTVESQKSNTASPLELKSSETMSSRTTTTTKSAHHLKILRKQQKSTSPNPLVKSQTLPNVNLLDENNVDDAFDDLFAEFNLK